MKIKNKRIRLFADFKTAIDEWTGEAWGLFLGKYCLIGLWSKYSQFALILFNFGFGVWLEDVK